MLFRHLYQRKHYDSIMDLTEMLFLLNVENRMASHV